MGRKGKERGGKKGRGKWRIRERERDGGGREEREREREGGERREREREGGERECLISPGVIVVIIVIVIIIIFRVITTFSKICFFCQSRLCRWNVVFLVTTKSENPDDISNTKKKYADSHS